MTRHTDLARLTDELVLSKMKQGVGYSPTDSASRLGYRTEPVRKVLIMMLLDGRVVVRKRDDRHNAYYLPAEPETKVSHGEFEVPTQPIHINLSGELVGYDAALNARASLCMTLRRIA